MFINSQNKPYFGDCVPGDREATPEEIAAWELSRAPAPPSPLEKIRALEAEYSDAQTRVMRQSLLAIALDRAMQAPAAAGLSIAQVRAALLSKDNGFKAMYELEQKVEELRAQL